MSEGIPRSVMSWLRVLIVVAVLIGICVLAWMLGVVASHIGNILTATVAAVLFAYLIFPPVRLLSTRIPRALAVLVVYVAVLTLIALAIAYLTPTVARQALELSRTLPATLQSLERQAADPRSSSLLKLLPPDIRAFVLANLARGGTIIGSFAASLGLQAYGILRGDGHVRGRCVADTHADVLLCDRCRTHPRRIHAPGAETGTVRRS